MTTTRSFFTGLEKNIHNDNNTDDDDVDVITDKWSEEERRRKKQKVLVVKKGNLIHTCNCRKGTSQSRLITPAILETPDTSQRG